MKIRKLLSLIVSAALALCIVPFAAEDSFAADKELIDHVDLTLTVPQCGTHISGLDSTGANRQTPQLEVTLPDGVPYSLNDNDGVNNYSTWYYVAHPEDSVPDSLQRFGDKDMVAGTYYAFIYLMCPTTYSFASADDLIVNVTNGKFEKVYFSGDSVDYGACTIIVSIDVEHVSDNTWTPDPDSYVNPSHDAPATHEEHSYCIFCGDIADTRTVTDALTVSEVSVTMPKLKEGDGYTIQYDEHFDADRPLPRPVVTIPEGVDYHEVLTAWVVPTEDGFVDDTEDRSFKAGDEVYISVILSPDEGYAFPFNDPVEEDPDMDINVEGGEIAYKSLISARVTDPATGEIGYINVLGLIVKVTVPGGTSPATGQFDITGYAIAAVISISMMIAFVYTSKKRNSQR